MFVNFLMEYINNDVTITMLLNVIITLTILNSDDNSGETK